jgi:hypothetical protein
MNSRIKTVLLWVLATLLMLSMAVYQRLTGPTHPARAKVTFDNTSYKVSLLRSHSSSSDAQIKLKLNDTAIHGQYSFKRLGTNDSLTTKPLMRQGETLIATLPAQPPAGKIQYTINLTKNGKQTAITDKPVVIRYKGDVPGYILIPHIFFMFFAMLFSLRTGIESLLDRTGTKTMANYTLLFLLIGGLILGPFVQKFAFGAYWTGWPFGHDLTDNKTLVAFVFWLIAVIKLRKNKNAKAWVIAATIIMLAVYLIPHSMFGSQLDYTSGQVTTGR